jgi:hypothetical protein
MVIKANTIKAHRLAVETDKVRAERKLGVILASGGISEQDAKQTATVAGMDFKMVEYWKDKEVKK